MNRLRRMEPDHVGFFCPGCREIHAVPIKGAHAWEWNGDLINPTLTPSLLTQSGHYAPGRAPGNECWCTWNQRHPDAPSPFECGRCHLFVRGGKIQFLPDCSHELAGKTVEMEAIT